MLTNYRVMVGDADGFAWINNQRQRVGDTVKLDPVEAKYMELSGQVEKVRDLAAAKTKAKAKVSGKEGQEALTE